MKEYTPEDFKYGYREISNGTFRLVDLIPAFEKELEEFQDFEIEKNRQEYGITKQDINDETEIAYDYLLFLEELLEDAAPEGYSFGSNEGDGASIGYWQTEGDL